MHLEEKAGGYQVAYNDAQVTQVTLDHRLSINILESEDDWLRITIESAFSAQIKPDAPATTIHPENVTAHLGELAVALRFQQLSKCHVASDGTLTVEFRSGLTINVPPDAHYEAWDLEHKQFKIVAMPGGELAVWDRTKGRKAAGDLSVD